jgi:glycosyltransferase involved in cell wall biosynthesis
VTGEKRQPLALLLLPRTLEEFILRDQAQDLLRAPGVIAVEAPQIRYGVLGRLPDWLGSALAVGQARRLKLPGEPRAIVIFHPFQYPLARALLDRHPGSELWYGRWDRYEEAYDAAGRTKERLRELHRLAAERSALTFVASTELERLEREADRDATLVPLAADSFPAPDPTGTVIGVSLGHQGWRMDWGLLRAVASELGDKLVVLLIGAWREDQSGDDPDFAACRAAPNIVWLGHRTDDEAARLILTADVGLLPFERSAFNDAALPYRILKYARLGRRTIATDLPGVATWERAVVRAPDVGAWVEALRAHAGARAAPDLELREWAVAQTAFRQNGPLWDRLEELGVVVGR